MLKYRWGDLLPQLTQRGLCLPAFDIAGGQQDFLQAVLGACQAARCPAVLLVYASPAALADLEACVNLVEFHASRSAVPVVLHLDHGREEAVVHQALEAGLRSVMYDGSVLPLEENIRRTKAMVELAHARGATIEGELGRIGAEATDGLGAHALTDPDEAARFVAETGVDLLAPAVGNAHGFYKAPPRLRFDLIAEIAARTRVPLSLHGGTGIPLADVRRAATLGMRKMNVATGLHQRFADALRAAASPEAGETFRWRQALAAAREAVSQSVTEYLTQLGAEGLV